MTDETRHERPDERDLDGLRSDHAGRGAEGELTSPSPGPSLGRDAAPPEDTEIARDAQHTDPGDVLPADHPVRSGQEGGQLGSAGGGYGSGSAYGSSGGHRDGEPGDPEAGPGPQTDWLRSAPGDGAPDLEGDPVGRAGDAPSPDEGTG